MVTFFFQGIKLIQVILEEGQSPKLVPNQDNALKNKKTNNVFPIQRAVEKFEISLVSHLQPIIYLERILYEGSCTIEIYNKMRKRDEMPSIFPAGT